MVVDEPVVAARQNARGVHGFNPALGMHAVKGQRRIADDVQPVETLGHAHAAFIATVDGGLRQQLHHPLLEGCQLVISALVGGRDGGLAQGLAVEVLANLGQPLVRDEMLLVEIDHLGPEARAVLDRGADAFGEGGAYHTARNRATFDLGLVFGHLQRFLGQIEDLALFVVEHGLLAQGAAVASAAGAKVQLVKAHVIGPGDRFSGGGI